ncbi:MAG: hypothetical protein CMQ16_07725 [Gammaproteobacteria bacterium]|nr:hypothetical protein [Gammaproteobacteria bacterium]
MRRYILSGRRRQRLSCIQAAAGQLKQASSLDWDPCEKYYQISTRTMTVNKTGHEPDQTSKESGPNLGKSDAEHKIAQECSLDPAKIVEVHRRIESGEYTVNARRIAGKLFDLESQLCILDQPGTEC